MCKSRKVREDQGINVTSFLASLKASPKPRLSVVKVTTAATYTSSRSRKYNSTIPFLTLSHIPRSCLCNVNGHTSSRAREYNLILPFLTLSHIARSR